MGAGDMKVTGRSLIIRPPAESHVFAGRKGRSIAHELAGEGLDDQLYSQTCYRTHLQ